MFKPLLLPLLCSLFALACQTGDDPELRSGEFTTTPGLRIHISDAGALSPTTVQSIAQHIEGQAQDPDAAMVRITHVDGPAPSLEIELWGGAVPGAGDLPGQLKAAFPALAGASITTATIPAGQAPAAPAPVDPDLGPAEAEQQIRDQLAADSVDGEIGVTIEDGPGGRRIAVDVKKTETH